MRGQGETNLFRALGLMALYIENTPVGLLYRRSAFAGVDEDEVHEP